ncbi:MAG: NAD(P)-dependent oxidoreductase [Phycisphaeraceae bacterium]
MNAPHKIVLSEHLDTVCADWLAERSQLVRAPLTDAPRLDAELSDADGLIVRTYTQVDQTLLDRAPKLRVVGRAGVGLDNIDLDACSKRDVTVVYTPDANTQAVVEYVWALIFDDLRPRLRLPGFVPPEQFHQHRQDQVGQQVADLTLGVLGMGRIGRRMAGVGRAFGCDVIYHDVLDDAQLKLPQDFAAKRVDRDTLLRDSDILTIHVDGRAENRPLFDAALLAKLNRKCLLINTSRGFVIDPASLADWAREAEGKGGRAVLDVHDPEPIVADYPVLGLANVQLLPHLASRTTTAMRNMSWVVRDVLRVLEGEKPDWPA